jgi:hypothetical protein
MIAMQALLRTVRDALLASQQFGERVYWGAAPQDCPYPYAVYFSTGGGDDNARAVKKSADITLQITCFSQDDDEASVGAAILDDIFDDRGEFDVTTRPMVAALDATGHGWHICTVMAVGDISTIERYENTLPIYQLGKEYQFILEEI